MCSHNAFWIHKLFVVIILEQLREKYKLQSRGQLFEIIDVVSLRFVKF